MRTRFLTALLVMLSVAASTMFAQLVDRNKAPNAANEGIARPLLGDPYPSQIGNGRNGTDPNTSLNVIAYDPFRAIRRGRQLFQRKFSRAEGHGPLTDDGVGDVGTELAIGAGLSDSCAGCHGRPRGAAGFGGDVATRPDSRDAPHLFGLGLKEMLADEITADLRAIRASASAQARATRSAVTRELTSKGIRFGSIRAMPSGAVDASGVEGVDPDLRVRPFFAHGGTISIREFVIGALRAEMGLAMAHDPDLDAAAGGPVVTPSGMLLDGTTDSIEKAPAAQRGDIGSIEQRAALVDFLEFYLLNYFKAGHDEQTVEAEHGRALFADVGCAACHVPDLRIRRDRRVADVETSFDPERGNFNRLFATPQLLLANPSSIGQSQVQKTPAFQPFLVKDIFTDFRRHDLGPGFYERNYDGSIRTHFLTTALWGVGSTAPYGHDGRSISLREVILRHGGEAQASRDAFDRLAAHHKDQVLAFLSTLILFPPDDTASLLDPGDRAHPLFPQARHGSIRLTNLFNMPAVVE